MLKNNLKRRTFLVSALLGVFLLLVLLPWDFLKQVKAGVNELTPVTVPFNLNVSAIAVSPAFPCDNTAFFATDGNGVYRTTSKDVDGVWSPVNNGLTDMSVLSLAISPNFDRCDRLKGTGDRTLFAGTRSGVFRSSDGSSTWVSVSAGLPTGKAIQALVISPNYASDKTVFVGMDGNLFRSTDSGVIWFAYDAGLSDRSVQAFAPSANFANDSTLFLGTRFSGVYRIAGKLSEPRLLVTPTPVVTPGAGTAPTPVPGVTPPSLPGLPPIPGLSYGLSEVLVEPEQVEATSESKTQQIPALIRVSLNVLEILQMAQSLGSRRELLPITMRLRTWAKQKSCRTSW
ncbi:MAG: hypothetical protein HW403_1426 [Dehalococcoidia bacterium]|nr:hypothetical protein [Dehalococcoidia bacterium]